MPDVIGVALAGTVTALATGLGAVPVFMMGTRAVALRPALWGFAGSVMVVAACFGLIGPAIDEGSSLEVGTGLAAGVAFLVVSRTWISHRRVDATRPMSAARGRALLVFGVLLVHSLPEGFAIGAAWASSVEGLALFVVLAIALQNVPEGTVTAIPLAELGASRTRQFWAAVATSIPQPIGAVGALLLVEEVSALLPFSFAFAGAAMLALAVTDLLPEALGRGEFRKGATGAAMGILLMLAAMWTIGI
jgi:ZIP family zinc transporter